MEYIALIAAIVAILVGAIELRNYTGREPANRKLVRLLIIWSLAALTIGYAVNSFYFVPKATAERFVGAFSRFDRAEMINSLCPDSPMTESLTGLGGALLSLGGLLGAVQISGESYSPFSRSMDFDWAMVSSIPNNQDMSRSATVYLRLLGFNEYCVITVDGL